VNTHAYAYPQKYPILLAEYCYIVYMTMTAEQFIAKANIIHNNKYSYEKTQYIGIKNKIIII